MHDDNLERLRVLDGPLDEAVWLAGDSYSIADIATLLYLRRQLADKPARCPNVERWAAAMMERPAVREGIDMGMARRRRSRAA